MKITENWLKAKFDKIEMYNDMVQPPAIWYEYKLGHSPHYDLYSDEPFDTVVFGEEGKHFKTTGEVNTVINLFGDKDA
jgi:hypothetical protein